MLVRKSAACTFREKIRCQPIYTLVLEGRPFALAEARNCQCKSAKANTLLPLCESSNFDLLGKCKAGVRGPTLLTFFHQQSVCKESERQIIALCNQICSESSVKFLGSHKTFASCDAVLIHASDVSGPSQYPVRERTWTIE